MVGEEFRNCPLIAPKRFYLFRTIGEDEWKSRQDAS